MRIFLGDQRYLVLILVLKFQEGIDRVFLGLSENPRGGVWGLTSCETRVESLFIGGHDIGAHNRVRGVEQGYSRALTLCQKEIGFLF
jgi:hypothetical protein